MQREWNWRSRKRSCVRGGCFDRKAVVCGLARKGREIEGRWRSCWRAWCFMFCGWEMNSKFGGGELS